MPSRAYIGAFGFKGPDQQKKAGVLSGGERNRLNLALTLKEGGNVLLLDEPTNDLDVDTLRALESALLDFAGEQAEAQGKPWVRLDCWRTNTALHAYYLARHFQHLRTVEVPGRGSGALFQRPAAERTGQLVQAPTLTILEDA